MKAINIRKIIMFLLLFLMFSFPALTGCNSREDVSHTNVKEIIKYVEEAIDEPVSFVEQRGKEADQTITYTFNLDERNIRFDVRSVISAPLIDGAQFGNYKEDIYIDYEEAIVNAEEYIKKREELALKYEINETVMYSSFFTQIENYNEIKKLSEYYLELDKIYAFKEKKPDLVKHITSGIIDNGDYGDIEGINFSTDSKERLTYDEIFYALEERYVGHLKYFSDSDKTIPEDVWNKYDAKP